MRRITKKDIVRAVNNCSRNPNAVEVHSEQVWGEPRFHYIRCGHKEDGGSNYVRSCVCALDGSFSEKTAENRAQYIRDAWEQKNKL